MFEKEKQIDINNINQTQLGEWRPFGSYLQSSAKNMEIIV